MMRKVSDGSEDGDGGERCGAVSGRFRSAAGEGDCVRAVRVLLLVAVLGSGCASLDRWLNTEEFILEVRGYRLWKEVCFLDRRTEVQWLVVCRTLSSEKHSAKDTDIVVTERDWLFQCSTGTVLKCLINRGAVASWESVAKRGTENLDLDKLRSRAEELERRAATLEQESRRNAAVASDASDARQEAGDARKKLWQAELYAGAVVVKAADIVKIEVLRTATGE